MSLLLILVFAGLFAIVLVAIAFGLKFIEDARKRQVSGMIRTVSGEAVAESYTSVLRPLEEDSLSQTFRELPFAGKWERTLKQAGLTWSVQHLVMLMVAGAVIGLLLGGFVRILGNPFVSRIGLALLLGTLPYLHVLRKRTKRLNEFEAQFPDALDFLARSMRAGHAFSVSLEMMGEEMADPIASEFRQVFNEQNLGMSIDNALKNLQSRVPSVDVGFFVSAVMLQKETGGNLAEILTKLAYIIRERFRLKLKVRTASAHGRLTGTILTLMPIALMLVLMVIVPGYLPSMVNDPVGVYLVGAALLSQCLAYLFIRKIIRIKV